jgi:hypothetical protein
VVLLDLREGELKRLLAVGCAHRRVSTSVLGRGLSGRRRR